MKLFTRAPKLPAEAQARLDPEEAVVAWAESTDGPVVVTPLGVWWPFPDGVRRVGFHVIDKVVWRDGELIMTEADVVDDLLLVDRRAVGLELTEPRHVPDAIRKRINQSVVRTEVLPVPGGSARFVARRVPGLDGLQWWARLEPGTPRTAPTREAVATIIAQLRANWLGERADH